MPPDSDDPLECITLAEVIGLARALDGELARVRAKFEELEGAFSKLKIEHQAAKDELARLKNLPPRPPQKPSGMDRATDRPESEAKGSKGGRSTERRGSNLDKLTVTRTVVVEVEAPMGSRRKGYEDIVVQDGAGQFRVGEHAACWVHAERLVYKLIPANAIQRNAVVIARRMIWWFYRALKDCRLDPTLKKAERLRAQFDRIFTRMRTGYATLDKLLRRLFRLKDDRLRVLDRPEIPLHTNDSERDIRVFVTKRRSRAARSAIAAATPATS